MEQLVWGDKKLHISKSFSNDDTLLSFLDINESYGYISPSLVSADNNINQVIYGVDIWENNDFEVAVNIYRNIENYEELISFTDYFSTNPCAPCISAFPLYDGDVASEQDPAIVEISTEKTPGKTSC